MGKTHCDLMGRKRCRSNGLGPHCKFSSTEHELGPTSCFQNLSIQKFIFILEMAVSLVLITLKIIMANLIMIIFPLFLRTWISYS